MRQTLALSYSLVSLSLGFINPYFIYATLFILTYDNDIYIHEKMKDNRDNMVKVNKTQKSINCINSNADNWIIYTDSSSKVPCNILSNFHVSSLLAFKIEL